MNVLHKFGFLFAFFLFFSINSLAWHSVSYQYRRPLDCSNALGLPRIINGSGGFILDATVQEVWINGTTGYVYYNSETNYTVTDNSDVDIPFEVEQGNGTSYNAVNVWGSKTAYNMKNVTDSTGTYDLTANGNADFTNGYINDSGVFDGVDDWFSTSYFSMVSTYVFEAVVNVTDNNKHEELVNFRQLNNGYILMRVQDSGGGDNRIQMDIYDAGGAQSCIDTDGFDGEYDKWVHLVGTYDGATVRIWKNGELVHSCAGINPPAGSHGTDGHRFGNDLSDSWDYQGKIDAIREWEVNLSADQINATYQNYQGTSGFCTLGAEQEDTEITWTGINTLITNTTTANKDLISTPAYNATMNLTSGTIERFWFNDDNEDNWTDLNLNTNDQAQFGFSGSSTFVSQAQTGAHTNSTLGFNNDPCELQSDLGVALIYNCSDHDTVDLHRFDRTVKYYLTYFDTSLVNVTGGGGVIGNSLNTEITEHADTERFNSSSVSASNVPHAIIMKNGVFSDYNLYGSHNSDEDCTDQWWNPKGLINLSTRGGGTCENKTMRLGYDNLTESNTRAEFWHRMTKNTLGLNCLDPTDNMGRARLDYHVTDVDQDVPKYYTEPISFTDDVDSCISSGLERFQNATTLYKLWSSYDGTASEFSGVGYNRTFYYANQTHLVYSTPSDCEPRLAEAGGCSESAIIRFQFEPILGQWYNRTWRTRYFINITPTSDTLHPEREVLLVDIPNTVCPSNRCNYSNTRGWRLVNDMQEEIEFVAINNSTTSFVYFRAYQLFNGNDTSYFLYTANNSSVSNRTLVSGTTTSFGTRATFAQNETLNDNTSLATTVPTSVPFRSYFDVKFEYLCVASDWSDCIDGDPILGAVCSITIDGNTFNLPYDSGEGSYIQTFNFGDTTAIQVWNGSCTKNFTASRSANGTITPITPCGWEEGVLDQMDCALEGTKGFFQESKVGLVEIIIILGIASLIITIFSIAPVVGGAFRK